MIVLIDLDNTLVDREAAFGAWAASLVAEAHGDAADVAWLLHQDEAGYRPRAEVALALIERLHLRSTREQMVDRLLFEHVDLIRPFPSVSLHLKALKARGVCLVVVTNGTVAQQTQKLARSGLDQLVDHVVISEAVGAKKPDSLIFDTAIRLAQSGGGSGAAWMVGDHPVADIAGGRACGLQTGWVSHGNTWAADWAPTVSGQCTRDVLEHLLMTEAST